MVTVSLGAVSAAGIVSEISGIELPETGDATVTGPVAPAAGIVCVATTLDVGVEEPLLPPPPPPQPARSAIAPKDAVIGKSAFSLLSIQV